MAQTTGMFFVKLVNDYIFNVGVGSTFEHVIIIVVAEKINKY